MKNRRINSQQLVIRVDTATGMANVGWASDLPPGRFTHIELVCENDACSALDETDPIYPQYLEACAKSARLNQALLRKQIDENCRNGWLAVPENANDSNLQYLPDNMGSYRESAMALLFHLTQNHVFVWCVVHSNKVTYIQSKQPPRNMDNFEYHVWRQHMLNKLQSLPGVVREGRLFVQESGLWFSPDVHP